MSFTYPLPDGTLTLHTRDEVAPDAYLKVAARNNPNRAFLFVSKVLGKHLPTPPQVMTNTHAQLARLLTPYTRDNTAPLLFIGMAETATALARGVYEHWLSDNPGHQSLYIATSRYLLSNHQRIEFTEAHSHAPAIGLHLPNDAILCRRFSQAQTLVLIDDELSTGNTFVNLIHTLQARGLKLKQVIMVSLTDFAGKHSAEIAEAIRPLNVYRLSLLQGEWHYRAERPSPTPSHWKTQSARRISLPGEPDLAARSGTDRILTFTAAVRKIYKQWLSSHRRLLILGCGEFMYPPYRLAAEVATHGIEVDFCATTRSPIRCWGEIHNRLEWPDPYGEGIGNFLYNYRRNRYDAVWLVSELPGNDLLRRTACELQARLLYLPREDTLEDHTFY